MTPENFCYFLKGYFELYEPKTLDEKETRVVWDHLNLVFNKVTPDRSVITLHSPKTPILGLDPNFEYTIDGQKIQRQSYTIPFDSANSEENLNSKVNEAILRVLERERRLGGILKSSSDGASSPEDKKFDYYPPITGHPPFNILSANLDQSTISPSQISITC